MNRGQITARVLQHLERGDTEANTLSDDWVREVIREIEDTYPYPYLKKNSDDIALTANQGVYSLPSTPPNELILHHPFLLRLEAVGDSTSVTPLIKIGEQTYNLNYTDTDATSAGPTYYYLKGGTNALDYEVVKIPDQNRTIDLVGGYFYTDLSTWNDTDDAGGIATNWLTANRPNLVIAGVLAKGFMFYDQNEKADRWFGIYQLELNGDPTKGIAGLIGSTKKMVYGDRRLRVRLAYDEPYGIRKRNIGY